MNEKSTIYLKSDVKEKVQIQLIKDGDNKSLSALVNELLEKWLRERERY